MSPENYFTQEQKETMVKAIQEAERNTSGEIRIHFENRCENEVFECAKEAFIRLNMHQTAQRNGILFYIALEDKKLAILGDTGINAKVPENFWDDIKNGMIEKFRTGHICEGVCRGVKETGVQLKKYFPYQQNDVNELPDDISFKNKQND